MAHSSVSSATSRSRLRKVRADGTPVYRHEPRPGLPTVSATRFDVTAAHSELPLARPHAHDFLVLLYVEEGTGAVSVDGSERLLQPGAVHAISPGQVIDPVTRPAALGCTTWSLAFAPEAVPALALVSPLTWPHHPLLALFASGAGRGRVGAAERASWSRWLADLSAELARPDRPGAGDAIAATLTRILVASARLAPTEPKKPEPLVERVFEQIEATYRDPVSARDVAGALGYTPGHLTTVVRERTGRTVLEWITERRMTEVRRLLRETDLPLGVIAAQTGLRDATYLVRRFRHHYGTTPQRWRTDQRVSPTEKPGEPEPEDALD